MHISMMDMKMLVWQRIWKVSMAKFKDMRGELSVTRGERSKIRSLGDVNK